jgi:ribosomal protein S18 acetylase RimI-like enzyme
LIEVRPATDADLPFLREMLYEAAFWRGDDGRPPIDEAFATPQLGRYLDGFGRPGDTGVIAVDAAGRPLGAAWYRRFSPREPGYGFVDGATPELSIAVAPGASGRGVGARLLAALLDRARAQGLPGLSLSVANDNPARRLYERAGFEVVHQHGGSTTMRALVVAAASPEDDGR